MHRDPRRLRVPLMEEGQVNCVIGGWTWAY